MSFLDLLRLKIDLLVHHSFMHRCIVGLLHTNIICDLYIFKIYVWHLITLVLLCATGWSNVILEETYL